MKRSLFIITLIIICALMLGATVYAEGSDDTAISVSSEQTLDKSAEINTEDADDGANFDLASYIIEKIIPVAAGVATSLVALGGTIYKIRGSLSTLNSSNDSLKEVKKTVSQTLDNVKRELTSGLHQVEDKISDIPEIKESYKELKTNYSELIKQNKALLEAIKLGFESMPEAVQSGNARKIAIIAEEAADEK